MPGRLFLAPDAALVSSLIPDGYAVPEPFGGDDIAPGQMVLVLQPAPRLMRWGMLPVGRVNARGRPVMETIINVRSEILWSKSAFQGVGFCVVPANGWFEWTGEKRKKQRWRLRPADGSVFGFAAVCDRWSAPGGQELWQVATVTCEPSAEVRAIHHRMGVLLRPDRFASWIDGPDEVRQEMCQPTPESWLSITPD